jgi:hypothetical protein
MTRTHEKVRYLPGGKHQERTPVSAAEGVEGALKILEGRWTIPLCPALDTLLTWFEEHETQSVPEDSASRTI